MQAIQRLLTDPFFESAFAKYESGVKVHKYELKAIVEDLEFEKNTVLNYAWI